jgi:AcrR family transcriptional regulator
MSLSGENPHLCVSYDMGMLPTSQLDANHGTPGVRPPRSDALRSRAKILSAARAMLAADGPDVALDRVARQAGVGNATLYRHFPTRAALLTALFYDQTASLCGYAVELARGEDSFDSLRTWLKKLAHDTIANAGLVAALRGMDDAPTDSNACHHMINDATKVLVDSAFEAGRLRDGVTAADALLVVTGIALASSPSGDTENGERLVDYFVDGISAPAH